MSKFIRHRAGYFYGKQSLSFYIGIFSFVIVIGLLPILAVIFYKNPASIAPAIKCIFPIILVLAVFIYNFLKQTFRIFTNFTRRSKLEAGASFLSKLRQPDLSYCLVIRPFGNDGGLIFAAEEHQNPFSTIENTYEAKEDLDDIISLNLSDNNYKYQIPFIGNLDGRISNFLTEGLRETKVPVSIEEVVAEIINTNLKAETICLADPMMSIFPKAVKYITATEENWRDLIDILLRKSIFTVLIYQPETLVGESTKWEIEKIRQLGLLERFIILLPLPNSHGYLKAYESLKSLKDVLPFAPILPRKLDKKPIAIWLEGKTVKLYYAKDEDIITSKDYGLAVFIALKSVKNHLQKIRRQNLHPHWDSNLINNFNKKHQLKSDY